MDDCICTNKMNAHVSFYNTSETTEHNTNAYQMSPSVCGKCLVGIAHNCVGTHTFMKLICLN